MDLNTYMHVDFLLYPHHTCWYKYFMKGRGMETLLIGVRFPTPKFLSLLLPCSRPRQQPATPFPPPFSSPTHSLSHSYSLTNLFLSFFIQKRLPLPVLSPPKANL